MSVITSINSNLIQIGGNLLQVITDTPTPALPPYTLRLKFTEGVTPTFSKGTGVQVSSSPNIWDLTYENTNWAGLIVNRGDLLEVLGANTTGVTDMSLLLYNCQNLYKVSLFDTSSVTNMERMFGFCYALTTVPLYDTSSVTNAECMFQLCYNLTSIPLFNTSSMTNMQEMFNHCVMVETGALALYQQASSQLHPPSNHLACFTNCGSNTQTGAAELAQIPEDWKQTN